MATDCDEYRPFSSSVPPITISYHFVQVNRPPCDTPQDPPDPLLRVAFRVDLFPQLGLTTYILR